MRKAGAVFSLAVFFLAIAVSFSQSNNTLQVDEARTLVRLESGTLRVSLAVTGNSARPFRANIRFELLDTTNSVRGRASIEANLRAGANLVEAGMPVSLGGRERLDARELMWYRLRYRVEPASGEAIEGILSLSEIDPQLFHLSVTGLEFAKPGGTHFARVRAVHPVTAKPVAGVSVQGLLTVETDGVEDVELRATTTTNSRGMATLKFPLPQKLPLNGELDLEVTGRLGAHTAEVTTDARAMSFLNVLLNTDKPIYQPGQQLHARVLLFDANKRAVAGQQLTFKLLDPENTLVFRADAETSEYGIASASWTIPDNLRLGRYVMRVEMDDDPVQYTSVRIGQYDLPTFVVTAKTDRQFYLPGQDAEVEVAADYLFGEPVRHAKARVVRESDREWNFKLQKWEIDEEESAECVAESGRCKVKFDLSETHVDLSDEDSARYRDLRFAAYMTDATTGRTEQRRFELRVTRDPIHVYVTERYRANRDDFPIEFYISTSYADGKPAECDVEINAVYEEQRIGEPEPRQSHQFLRRVRTNRYGVARVSRLSLPDDERYKDYVSFRARDKHGAIGRHTEGFYFADIEVMRVTTNKALYREGEPIEAQLESSLQRGTVTIDAVRDWKVLATSTVRLRNGKAFTIFPTTKEFSGEVTLVAHGVGTGKDDGDGTAQGARTVLFPRDQELKLDVQFAKASYRPGEKANAEIRVRGPDGLPVKSAVGLAVIDRAVEERARIDSEFNGRGGFFSFLGDWYRGAEIGGITRASLDKVDMSQPLPAGLDLAAEAMLYPSSSTFWLKTERSESEPDLLQRFNSLINPHVLAIKTALSAELAATDQYPKSEAMLRKLLDARGVNFDALRDPWGNRYYVDFSIWLKTQKMDLRSAGPDKRRNTDDDFEIEEWVWPYFRKHAAIVAAVKSYNVRTNGYIRDEATLKAELKKDGVDFETLRDPWNRPYRLRFDIDGSNFTVRVLSDGPDSKATTDDVSVASAPIDYFEYHRGRIDSALAGFIADHNRFPKSEAELHEALRGIGLDPDSLRDPWQRAYYTAFHETGRYADNVVIQSYTDATGQTRQQRETLPVTQAINWIYFRSSGPDGVAGTNDDFNVASFSRIFSQRASSGKVVSPVNDASMMTGSSGSLTGIVMDATGAVVGGADVKAEHASANQSFTTKTNEDGRYVLRNLPPGFYHVRVAMMGFKDVVITGVPVRSSSITEVNATLQVGEVTSTVVVEAEAAVLETTSASVSMLALRDGVALITKSGAAEVRHKQDLATPRLREYFPETLLWQPELLTDGRGRATLTLPLADNITTWKLSGVASTLDGRIGTAEKEIRALQPFFVEHDPPKFLTVGDEIALPVVLRNYLDRPLVVHLSVTPQPWFQNAGSATTQTQVPAGGTSRALFPLRAVSPIAKGLHRVTAAEREIADAIEKPITVRPFGDERVATVSQVLRSRATVELNLPENMLPDSTTAELKIYPNHLAHVMESVEAVMSRPYGCGEQTISSAYPSVLLLKYAPNADAGAQRRAKRYVQLAYERLLGYQSDSGGFRYWTRGEPDVALTAYALRFLNDASEFVAVDESLVSSARAWLIKQMASDGSWSWRGWNGVENPHRTAIQSAYVTRVLAAYGAQRRAEFDAATQAGHEQMMNRALRYLEPAAEEFGDPYVIATVVLAARDAGNPALAEKLTTRLSTMAHTENAAAYWDLKSNTPFYGWGMAGRVETTALVVRSLLQSAAVEKSSERMALADAGLLFLLRAKDRYGVWYSTQSTINVLEALLASVTQGQGDAGGQSRTATIVVNGKPAGSVELPVATQVAAPIRVEVTQHLRPGANQIEIVREAATSSATVQVVASSYVPWPQAPAARVGGGEAASGEGLLLSVSFDKREVEVGGEVKCSVRAERVGHRGYGMMLAEIGLPPGAEVDRASLERAVESSGWAIGRYDVLPDRVIVYLWPRAGGTRFEFTLRPRFGMSAKTPASILYDYYNPEERAVLPPAHFVAQERREP